VWQYYTSTSPPPTPPDALDAGTTPPYSSGEFTLTLTTGLTTQPSTVVRWQKLGSVVMMTNVSAISGTSNGNTKFATGMPMALAPTGGDRLIHPSISDASPADMQWLGIYSADGSWEFKVSPAGLGWAATGAWSFKAGQSFSYHQ